MLPRALVLLVVGESERPVLERLVQLYLHEFGGEGGPDLDRDGTFPYPELARYGNEAGCDALLAMDGDRPVGFALVTPSEDGGRFVEDFFVVRGNRRGGVGTQIARALFARTPGPWRLSVRDTNPAALAFWRRALAGYGASETHDVSEGIGRTFFELDAA